MQQYGLLQDAEAMDYGRFQDNMALVQPQVMEMLQNGVMPSDDMLQQSGLSKEYLQMLMANGGLMDQGGDGRRYVAESSDWFNGDKGNKWLASSDGQWWLKSEEGKRWKEKHPDEYAQYELRGAYLNGYITESEYQENLAELEEKK